MPAYAPISRHDIARNWRRTRGTISSAPVTSSMRHHTSGSACKVISLPRIAVKPHSNTQK